MRWFVVVGLLWALPVFGADWHVRDGASGAGTGLNWTDAWEDMGNINWTSVQRGDTIYFADGSYVGDNFNKATSGTTRIFLLKAIESDHGSNTGWLPAYGDGVADFTNTLEFSTSYWTISGQVGTGESGHGFKRTMTNSQGHKGIRITEAQHITIEHMEIDGTAGSAQRSHDGIYSLQNADDLIVRHAWIHDVGRALLLVNRTDRGLVEHSVISRPNTNLGQHSEIASISEGSEPNPALIPNDWVWRYNVITDCLSTGGIITSGLRWKIYGNIFTNTANSGQTCPNGIFGGWSDQPGGEHQIYYNTFVWLSVNSQCRFFAAGGAAGSIVRNNLFYNCNYVPATSATRSHNAFGDSGNPGEANQQILSSTCSAVFQNCGANTYWEQTDDYRLVAATDPAFSLPAEFNTDPDGNPRGADGVADRGAYEFVDAPMPAGLTVLRNGIHRNQR